jgi:hypothetical protein
VGWALYTRVYQTGIPTAYVDVDQMGMCYPAPDDDPHNHRVKSHNLGIITTGYRHAGATRLVVTGAVTTQNELQLYLDAIPEASWTTCRLTGSRRRSCRARHCQAARPGDVGNRRIQASVQHSARRRAMSGHKRATKCSRVNNLVDRVTFV